MTSRQFSEWLAYYGLEPFGEQRADLRAGIISSTMFNLWRGKRTPPTRPSDFMPSQEKTRQTPQQQIALARMIAEAYAAKHGHDSR